MFMSQELSIESAAPLAFPVMLADLEAAGEVTRLRILGLLDEAELTVSELVAILGQSQPSVSRHLKLLVDAGLAARQREGAWAFFRLADEGGAFARDLVRRVDPVDPVLSADRAGSRSRERRGASRRRPISPSGRRIGTGSAPCTRPTSGSRRRFCR